MLFGFIFSLVREKNSGDSNYTASDSSFIVTNVNPATPTVTLGADANQVAAGTQTSLTVSILGRPSSKRHACTATPKPP